MQLDLEHLHVALQPAHGAEVNSLAGLGVVASEAGLLQLLLRDPVHRCVSPKLIEFSLGLFAAIPPAIAALDFSLE